MRSKKQATSNSKVKLPKALKPLTNQQLESVVGGPVSSRGTETNVQYGD